MPRIYYRRQYNIGFFGLERLHPFDSRKYGRAFGLLRERFRSRLAPWVVEPRREVSQRELEVVHCADYLERDLRSSRYLAQALELPPVALLPAGLIDRAVIAPMRWATMGTIEAARAAVTTGELAVNLSGGYHHASADRGEGFCLLADVGVAVELLRRAGELGRDDRVLYIDVDAHQGNGVARVFSDDPTVAIFDIYNGEIYPGDEEARRRVDVDLPLPHGTGAARYLRALRTELPAFIDGPAGSGPPALAIYNAGTDVFEHDALGGLRLPADAVVERDLFVAEQLQARKIPWVMLLSGGYSRQSYKLVARTVIALLERWGASS